MQAFGGFDNGVTGSIACVFDDLQSVYFDRTPIRKCLNYTKTKQWINRIDTIALTTWIEENCMHVYGSTTIRPYCMIERPMVNPGRFKATTSALRALEATMIVLEHLHLPYEFVDSKEWQRALLPAGLEKDELKKAAVEVARRLFPTVDVGKDADGLLIAEYCRRKKMKGGG